MSRRHEHKGVIMEGGLAFLHDAKAVVKFMGPKAAGPAPVTATENAEEVDARTTGDQHTPGVVKVMAWGAERNIQYALWGTNNLRPDDLLVEAGKNGILKAALTTRRNVHYGSGPMYYNLVATGDREKIQPLAQSKLPKEIREFHRKIQLEKVLRETIVQCEWWNWWGTEYLLSNNFQKITSYRPIKSAWLRWSLMNDETGRIEWCLLNPNWGLFSASNTEIIPVADPWWTPEEVRAWAKENGFTKFVRPNLMPDPDAGYYPDADWHSLYDDKWLQNTNKIPAYRDALLTNALTIKLLIKIPSTYLENKYKDTWGDMSDDERDKKRFDLLTSLNNFLSGVENGGKALVTEFLVGEDGKAEAGWEIIPIDHGKGGEQVGTSIADSEKGNSQILAVTRVDPTLLGQGAPGGKLGAGSGSDKAEAVRIMHALMYSDREQTTEDWYFTRDYNGWSAEIYMGYRPIELTSLDATSDNQPPANAS